MQTIEELRKEKTPKILDVIRFGTIGIVKYWNGFEMKYYIGQGYGIDEHEDTQKILNFGKPFILPADFYSLFKN